MIQLIKGLYPFLGLMTKAKKRKHNEEFYGAKNMLGCAIAKNPRDRSIPSALLTLL